MAAFRPGILLLGVVAASCSSGGKGMVTGADSATPPQMQDDGGSGGASAPETGADGAAADMASSPPPSADAQTDAPAAPDVAADTHPVDSAAPDAAPDLTADAHPVDSATPDAAAERGDAAAPGPSPLPAPSGTCPTFQAGDVTFQPPGGARLVTITMGDAAKTQSGPLIFYWYATGSSVREAAVGLPLPAITAAGGIVVAPHDVANAGTFPWLQNLAQHDALFDEVVACAVRNTLIDARRIHVIGFSAGALMTTHLSYARSGLLASVAAYSGGDPGTFQEMNNKFAALIFTGGPTDIVVQNFFQSSQQWQATLKDAGHFTLFCNHMGGHSIPTRLVPGVWQFFQDHRYGTVPSPYAGGKIPSSLAPPCVE